MFHVFTVEMTNGCIINDYITNSCFPRPSSIPLRPLCLCLRHKSCTVTQRHNHTQFHAVQRRLCSGVPAYAVCVPCAGRSCTRCRASPPGRSCSHRSQAANPTPCRTVPRLLMHPCSCPPSRTRRTPRWTRAVRWLSCTRAATRAILCRRPSRRIAAHQPRKPTEPQLRRLTMTPDGRRAGLRCLRQNNVQNNANTSSSLTTTRTRAGPSETSCVLWCTRIKKLAPTVSAGSVAWVFCLGETSESMEWETPHGRLWRAWHVHTRWFLNLHHVAF